MKKGLFFYITICLILLTPSTTILAKQKTRKIGVSEKWKQAGDTFFNDGEYLRALYCFQIAILDHPYNSYCKFSAGMASKELNWYGNTIFYWTEVYEYSEDYRDAGNLGTLYAEMGESSLALEYLNKTLEEAPNYPFALNSKGALLMGQGKYDESLVNLRKALEYDIKGQSLPQIYSNMSNVFASRDQLDSANFYLEKAIELKPNLSEVISTRLELLAKENKTNTSEWNDLNKQVIESSSKSLKKNPASFKGLYSRGLAYKRLGEKDKAIADFNSAIEILNELIELHPNAYRFLETRARIYKHLDDKEKALKDYQRILILNPTNPGAVKYIKKSA